MINQYLESTYLKTAAQENISEKEHLDKNTFFINEAIENNFKLIMLRLDMAEHAQQLIKKANANLLVGVVIDFPLGNGTTDERLSEIAEALRKNVDELDIVFNYTAFKNGELAKLKSELETFTDLVVKQHRKTFKWIIETAALTDEQIKEVCIFIKNTIVERFDDAEIYNRVFVKSSTGFYPTAPGVPNGATPQNIAIMLENAAPLPVKASGGVRNLEQALQMVQMGVKRIGTSSAKAIVDGQNATSDY